MKMKTAPPEDGLPEEGESVSGWMIRAARTLPVRMLMDLATAAMVLARDHRALGVRSLEIAEAWEARSAYWRTAAERRIDARSE